MQEKITWRENWKLELKLKVEEEAEIAEAEAAATEAAKSTCFFISGVLVAV